MLLTSEKRKNIRKQGKQYCLPLKKEKVLENKVSNVTYSQKKKKN